MSHASILAGQAAFIAFALVISPFGATSQQPTAPPAGDSLPTELGIAESAIADAFTKRCIVKRDSLRIAEPTRRSFGCYGSVHLTSAAEAEAFYGGFKVADVVAFSLGDQATLYSELISDNLFLWAGKGFARVGVGALVGASGDTAATTISQFFESGGNATVYLSIPAYRWINYLTDQTSSTPFRTADASVNLALRGDVPALNAAVEDPAFNAFAGITLQAVQRTSENRFRFFGIVHSGWVWSPQDEFYQNLGASRPEAGLLMLKATAGFDLNELIRIGASAGVSTLAGVSLPLRLSVQLLPQGR